MSALPSSIDRMPHSDGSARVSPEHVIAIALSTCDEKWAGRLLSESSRPVWTVMEALRMAGFEIVEKKKRS